MTRRVNVATVAMACHPESTFLKQVVWDFPGLHWHLHEHHQVGPLTVEGRNQFFDRAILGGALPSHPRKLDDDQAWKSLDWLFHQHTVKVELTMWEPHKLTHQ